LPRSPATNGPNCAPRASTIRFQEEAILKVEQRRRELELAQRRGAERRRAEVAEKLAAAEEARKGFPPIGPSPIAQAYGLVNGVAHKARKHGSGGPKLQSGGETTPGNREAGRRLRGAQHDASAERSQKVGDAALAAERLPSIGQRVLKRSKL
jgi:hypothetical protein